MINKGKDFDPSGLVKGQAMLVASFRGPQGAEFHVTLTRVPDQPEPDVDTSYIYHNELIELYLDICGFFMHLIHDITTKVKEKDTSSIQ